MASHVLIIVFTLRPELLRLVSILSRRLETATELTIGPKGIGFKGPVSPTVQQRMRELARIIRGLTDRQALDVLADALNVAKTPDIKAQRAAIIAAIDRRVGTVEDVDDLMQNLRHVLPEEFGR